MQGYNIINTTHWAKTWEMEYADIYGLDACHEQKSGWVLKQFEHCIKIDVRMSREMWSFLYIKSKASSFVKNKGVIAAIQEQGCIYYLV